MECMGHNSTARAPRIYLIDESIPIKVYYLDVIQTLLTYWIRYLKMISVNLEDK